MQTKTVPVMANNMVVGHILINKQDGIVELTTVPASKLDFDTYSNVFYEDEVNAIESEIRVQTNLLQTRWGLIASLERRVQ